MQNKGFTLVEVLVVAAIFIVMFIILAPVVQMTRERAHRINCANNLMKISLGLHLYAADHDDSFPKALGELYPNYVKDEKAFDCPAGKIVGVPERPDYNYVVGLMETSPQSEVIAYDLDGNHRDKGKNTLRVNGSVGWVGKGWKKL